MKNKKVLIIASSVLAVALIVLVAVLCLSKESAGGPATGQPQLGATTPGDTRPDGVTPGGTTPGGNGDQSPIIPDSEIHDYYPTVTFVTNNNEITNRVTPGTLPAIPSGESGYDNLVFVGWNNPISAITKDTTYEAIYEDISDKKNVFTLNTLYTTDNSAELVLSLRGKVKLSVADLEIHYDPTVVRVEDILKVDSSVQYNIMPDKGCIKVSVLLTENLEATMDCFKLKLSFVDPNASTAQLDITVADAAYQEAAGILVNAETGTISGKLIRIS